MSEQDKNIKDLKILITEEQIQTKIKELAQKIETAYNTNEDIYVICVLKGSVMFCADLVKEFKHNVQMEFIRIS